MLEMVWTEVNKNENKSGEYITELTVNTLKEEETSIIGL